MKMRSLIGVLAVLLMCGLFLGIGSCGSATDDVLGPTESVGPDGENDGEGDGSDDEGTDGDDDEAESFPEVGDEGTVDSV